MHNFESKFEENIPKRIRSEKAYYQITDYIRFKAGR